jgi:hypothetical protein
MLIINLEKFKETVSKFNKPSLKGLLDYLAFHRILCELVLVDNLNSCDKNGKLTPKSETLADYTVTLEGERILIGLLGRKESAKVYGIMEGISSDIKTVDYILANDSVQRYQKLIDSQNS